MTNFITNSEQTSLKSRLTQLIAKSTELRFLVGFFYFSGIRELYQSIKDNPDLTIKILVGLNVDKTIYGLHEFSNNHESSDDEKAYQFIESIKKSLPSNEFDTQEFYEQIQYFIKLIKEGKLILRKTFQPNHAKLYLFKLNEVGRQALFITGSSNLTRPGIYKQQEFNVEISDYGVKDAEEYFDQLWDEAVLITENLIIKDKLIQVIENDTHIKEITPFEAFLLIMKTYLDTFKQKPIGASLAHLMEKNGYIPYNYQLDAVKQALSIIDEYQGVIIADVVGLGKSVIASMIGHELNKRGLIIAPPGLVGDNNKTYGWKMYAEQFGLSHWEVRSLGEIDDIAKNINRLSDIEVIVVDEAHRFRNQDTVGYEHLKNICRGKQVILLTATPFNNRPTDILSLLELFTISKKANITLDGNLKNRFRIFGGMFDRLSYILKNYNSPKESNRKKAQDYFNSIFDEGSIEISLVKERVKYLAKEVRNVIEPVTIRRNRLDLISNPIYSKEISTLSKVNDPQEWFYMLTKEQSELYDKVLNHYFADPEVGGQFTGAIYRPFMYEAPPEQIDEASAKDKDMSFIYTQQRNLYEFIRRMLVKRFESSFASFVASLRNIRRVSKVVLDFVEKTDKYVLDRKLVEKISEWDIDEIEQELIRYAQELDNKKISKKDQVYLVNEFVYRVEFIADIKKDIALFTELIDKLEELKLVENDPKIISLINQLRQSFKQDPSRKIVVFSEYADTIKHLSGPLSDIFSDRVLVVAGELSTSTAKKIHQNFDASFEPQTNDYDILLTTDKVSEGFNLNNAGLVVNYDIPWNPVRVIQRVGRINRIGKKVFDTLQIANFFPTEQGASIVQSRTIAQNKMFLIHNTLGEDARIFEPDETPQPAQLYQRLQTNPDKLETASFYTTVLNLFEKYKHKYPQLVSDLDHYPQRVKVAKLSDENALYVFIRKGRLYIRSVRSDENNKLTVNVEILENIFDQLKSDIEDKRVDLSEGFWERYKLAKEYREDRNVPLSQNSIEVRALNNLSSLIQSPWDELLPYLEFLHLLKRDIVDYGSLPEYTLRRITEFKTGTDKQQSESVSLIKELRTELGDSYSAMFGDSSNQSEKEVIIAVENQLSWVKIY